MSATEAIFWEKQWQSAVENSPVLQRELNHGVGKMQRWNKMAKDFAGRSAQNKSLERRRQTVLELCAKGILKKDATVLDIGAGPGTWALPLAEQCQKVIALEPADAMADIMEERIRDAGVKNIMVHRGTWQSADLDALDWTHAFDLVFASMTPGIDGPDALKKMMAACRGYCYFSSFAEPGWQIQYAPLWQTFFNETMGRMYYDIIYPFNLVYTLGFHPSLTIYKWPGENIFTREEAVRMFIQYFENYMDVTRDARAVITQYIDAHSKGGKYIRPDNVRIGAMTWEGGRENQGCVRISQPVNAI